MSTIPLIPPDPTAERAYLAGLLATHHGAVRRVAGALGRSPGYVYRAIGRLGLADTLASYSRADRQPPAEARRPARRASKKSTDP